MSVSVSALVLGCELVEVLVSPLPEREVSALVTASVQGRQVRGLSFP